MTVSRVQVSEAAVVLSGFAFKSDLFSESEGVPLIRIRDVTRGHSKTFYTGTYSNDFLVDDGDILIGMDGNFEAARWKGGPALLNQRVCRIKGRPAVLDDSYLFHFLAPALKKIEDATPFVTVKHLSAGGVRGIEIPFPPLPEQRRIAAILDQADALRAKRREALAQLDSLTQSIFIEMFGDPARNTLNLPLTSLSDIGPWRSGGTPPRGQQHYFDGNVPWFSSGELESMYVERSAEHISELAIRETSVKLVSAGSLMLGMYDTAALKASIATVDCACNQAIAFSLLDPDRAEVSYVYFAIVVAREHFRRLQRGVRQKNLNLSMIRDIQIPAPPIAQQRAFSARIQAVELVRATHRASLAELDALFASLQHRAFAGQLS